MGRRALELGAALGITAGCAAAALYVRRRHSCCAAAPANKAQPTSLSDLESKERPASLNPSIDPACFADREVDDTHRGAEFLAECSTRAQLLEKLAEKGASFSMLEQDVEGRLVAKQLRDEEIFRLDKLVRDRQQQAVVDSCIEKQLTTEDGASTSAALEETWIDRQVGAHEEESACHDSASKSLGRTVVLEQEAERRGAEEEAQRLAQIAEQVLARQRAEEEIQRMRLIAAADTAALEVAPQSHLARDSKDDAQDLTQGKQMQLRDLAEELEAERQRAEETTQRLKLLAAEQEALARRRAEEETQRLRQVVEEEASRCKALKDFDRIHGANVSMDDMVRLTPGEDKLLKQVAEEWETNRRLADEDSQRLKQIAEQALARQRAEDEGYRLLQAAQVEDHEECANDHAQKEETPQLKWYPKKRSGDNPAAELQVPRRRAQQEKTQILNPRGEQQPVGQRVETEACRSTRLVVQEFPSCRAIGEARKIQNAHDEGVVYPAKNEKISVEDVAEKQDVRRQGDGDPEKYSLSPSGAAQRLQHQFKESAGNIEQTDAWERWHCMDEDSTPDEVGEKQPKLTAHLLARHEKHSRNLFTENGEEVRDPIKYMAAMRRKAGGSKIRLFDVTGVEVQDPLAYISAHGAAEPDADITLFKSDGTEIRDPATYATEIGGSGRSRERLYNSKGERIRNPVAYIASLGGGSSQIDASSKISSMRGSSTAGTFDRSGRPIASPLQHIRPRKSINGASSCAYSESMDYHTVEVGTAPQRWERKADRSRRLQAACRKS